MSTIKQIVFSGGSIASWQFGAAMGLYDIPHWSAGTWAALWVLAWIAYCFISPLAVLRR